MDHMQSMPPTPKYPTITDATLVPFRAIEIQLKEIPDFLTRAECPYSPAVRLFLGRLAEGDAAPVVAAAEMGDDTTIQEITDLYAELKRVAFVGGQVGRGDSKDQMAVIKTASDLLSKLVDLKSKAFSVRDMSRFQRAVVDMLEGVLTPAQRSEFIDRLGAYTHVQ